VRRAVRDAESFRKYCHAQHRAWKPGDDGRSDLWLSRAEGMSAFIDWMNADRERAEGVGMFIAWLKGENR
jgi:hypothetical protein